MRGVPERVLDLLQADVIGFVCQQIGGKGGPELVDRDIVGAGHGRRIFLDHAFNGPRRHPRMIAADKERVSILWNDFFRISYRKIVINRFPTALRKKHDTLFVAFPEYSQVILIDIRDIQRDQL